MERFRGEIIKVANENGDGTLLLDKEDVERFVDQYYPNSPTDLRNKLLRQTHFLYFCYRNVSGYCGETLFIGTKVSFVLSKEKLFDILIEELPSRFSIVRSAFLELFTVLILVGVGISLVLWLKVWVVYLIVAGLAVLGLAAIRIFFECIKTSLEECRFTRKRLLRPPQA